MDWTSGKANLRLGATVRFVCLFERKRRYATHRWQSPAWLGQLYWSPLHARQSSGLPPLTIDEWLHVLSSEKLVLEAAELTSASSAKARVDAAAPKASKSCALLLGHLGRFERVVGSSRSLVRLACPALPHVPHS